MDEKQESYFDREDNPNSWLKRLKRELGIRAAHRLLAMSSSNDPFNKGTEGDFQKAQWFASVYEKFGYHGIHLRRLHYRMVHSDKTLTLWDGQTEYLNIERHWEKLQEASTTARILRVVNAYDFTEKRNKARPSLYQSGSNERPEADFWVETPDYRQALPMAGDASGLPDVFGFTPYPSPTFEVSGYDYGPDLQPNIVELWSEAEDSILHSLALQFGINYVPGLGFASLTAIKTMLRRIEASGVPGRILYVADFDPAGQAMPISVARHCQFACWELEELAGEEAPHIKVDNVAVTAEQVERLGIPGIPIKETDTRKARFELQHGERSAVEVEALEAIHPGELARILRKRIEELLDPGLADQVESAREEAHNLVKEALDEIQDEYREDLEDIAQRARAIAERYQILYEHLGSEVAERYRKLSERFERHVEPLREELETIEDEVRGAATDLDLDLPDLPEGEASENEDRVWLFDSERDFVDQTEHFRKIQGKDEE
jgi:hypothetical protein